MSQIIENLKRLGVLRESLFGDAWLVLYTEDGPKDITLKTLEKELTK